MMKLSIFETGFFKTDGGAMFGLLPKEIWKKYYPSDNKNLCFMSMRCALVEIKNRIILIDAGIGVKPESKVPGFGFCHIKNLSEELLGMGIDNSQITDVILTHLHFDHSEGITYYNNEDKLSLTYPNANYYVGEKQWNRCFHNSIYDSHAFFPDNILLLKENKNLHLLKENFVLDENIRLELYDGHTPGQIVVFIDKECDADDNIVFPSDVIPTCVNIRTESVSGADLNSEVSVNEKCRLLNKVYESDARLVFYHDSYVQSCKVGKSNSRFFAKDKVKSSCLEHEKLI